MIRINICPLPTGELLYLFIGMILSIYWVLISHEFWSLVDLLVEIDAIMQQTLKLQLSIINYIKFNSISRLQHIERALVEDCINQRCERRYSEL